MHYSRLCALLIDCNTPDIDDAARFWSEALGRAIDFDHPGTRGDYRMLATPPDEPIVQLQRVGHESRVHIDIETDDIPAEVARLEKLGAKVVNRLERWVVMEAPSGQRFCVVRISVLVFPRTRTAGNDHALRAAPLISNHRAVPSSPTAPGTPEANPITPANVVVSYSGSSTAPRKLAT